MSFFQLTHLKREILHTNDTKHDDLVNTKNKIVKTFFCQNKMENFILPKRVAFQVFVAPSREPKRAIRPSPSLF